MGEPRAAGPSQPGLEPRHHQALLYLAQRLGPTSVPWALTGSMAQRLQGLAVAVRDIDVQSDRDGVHRIASLCAECVVNPVEWRDSGAIRSHFGRLVVHGVEIELMGDIEIRTATGTWSPPPDVAAARRFVRYARASIPVFPLEHERRFYEQLGRHDRAALLADHMRLHM